MKLLVYGDIMSVNPLYLFGNYCLVLFHAMLTVKKWYLSTVNTRLSRWTTKCWSTQRGLACRQALNLRRKIVSPLWLFHWISPGDWSASYCDWFIPRRGGMKTTFLLLHSRKLVVISSLVYLVLRACTTLASVASHLVELFSVASFWELISVLSFESLYYPC
jgi:hypothetical protein